MSDRLVRAVRLSAVMAALALVIGACGADQNGDQITSPLSSSRTSTTRTGPAAAGSRSTTTGASRTVATRQLPGVGRPTVLLGDMNTPEQFVMGQLYAYALRAQGYTVAVSRNIGVPAVAQQAMRQGSLDVYPDYLNQFNEQVAGDHERYRTRAGALSAARRYAARHHLVLLNPTPFSDVDGLAVNSAFATQNRVRSLRQLASGPLVIVGSPLVYTHLPSGLPAIELAYGLHPAYVTPVAIGEQYLALDQNVAQAVYSQSTDPELDDSRYVMLSDPLHVNGFGNVVPVTTQKVLTAEGPAFAATLNRVDALLTLEVIRGLNNEVQLNHADPGQVAEQFLEANGLVPNTSAPAGT